VPLILKQPPLFSKGTNVVETQKYRPKNETLKASTNP